MGVNLIERAKRLFELTVTAYDSSEVHSSSGDMILSPDGNHPVLK